MGGMGCNLCKTLLTQSQHTFDNVVCVSYKRILIVISHSQDFLNGVCTNVIHMHQRKLHYYTVSLSVSLSVCVCKGEGKGKGKGRQFV